MKPRLRFRAGACFLLLLGCSHAPPGRPGAPSAEASSAPAVPSQARPRPYQLVDGQTGTPLSDEAWGRRLREARLVFVGERHDDAAHHAVQADVLARVHAEDPSVGVALEMLPHTMQKPLDDFVQGRLSETEFLTAVDWEKTWGYPFGLYRPLLAFAREHDLPAFALNAPRELTRAISRTGLENLSPEDAARLPEMDPGPAAHREFARQAFASHVTRRFSDHKFERFYQAQLAWDETMAAQLAQGARAPGAPTRIVVVAGEGHTRRFAIPLRAARRGVEPSLLVLAVERDDVEDAKASGVADVLAVFQDAPPEGAAPP